MPHKTGLSLITFPRSGSVFLFHMLLQNTWASIEKSHSIVDPPEFPVVTIIRNPFDSILSEVAMMTHYVPTKNIKEVIDGVKERYLSSYEYFLNYADAIIDYDLLIKDPQATILSIGKHFDLKLKSPISVPSTKKDMPERNHLTTSRTSKTYKLVLDELGKCDLGEEWGIYNKILSSPKLIPGRFEW